EANRQTDSRRRAQLFQQAETILVCDEVPIAPVYFYNGFNYYNPARIQGVHSNLLDLHPINAIWKKSVVSGQLSVVGNPTRNSQLTTGDSPTAPRSRPMDNP